MSNIWQVAAGMGSSGGRDYSEVFLKYGVMLIGPGDHGPYPQDSHRYEDEDERDIKRFVKPKTATWWC